MTRRDRPAHAEAFKACCADLYSREGVRLLLGETLHPGGLALTARVAELLELTKESRVLDVAAGPGASARYLARTIGCRVDALDISTSNLTQARRDSELAGVAGSVRVLVADAEALPYGEGVFDAVVTECAFSTFPDKARAAREIFRVLRPGGRVGVSDVTVAPDALPADLRGTLLRAACLADAGTPDRYRSWFLQAGFAGLRIEAHPEALSGLLGRVRARLRLGRLANLAGLLPGDLDLDAVERVVDQIDGLVRQGKAGYVLLIGERPDDA